MCQRPSKAQRVSKDPLHRPLPSHSLISCFSGKGLRWSSHAGCPPTWRSLASNAIPLPGPVLMLTVPAATFLLVLLPVIFSNLPSLQMRSLRGLPFRICSLHHIHLRQQRQRQALPMSLLSMASSSLFCSVQSFGRLNLRAPIAHFSRLASLSSLVKTHWQKPSNFHRFLWNIVFTCPSAIRGLFSQLLTVPLYRQPNTLGWPYLDIRHAMESGR